MNFIAELQNLDFAIAGTLLLGAFWWAYMLTSRTRAEQVLDRRLTARRP